MPFFTLFAILVKQNCKSETECLMHFSSDDNPFRGDEEINCRTFLSLPWMPACQLAPHWWIFQQKNACTDLHLLSFFGLFTLENIHQKSFLDSHFYSVFRNFETNQKCIECRFCWIFELRHSKVFKITPIFLHFDMDWFFCTLRHSEVFKICQIFSHFVMDWIVQIDKGLASFLFWNGWQQYKYVLWV